MARSQTAKASSRVSKPTRQMKQSTDGKTATPSRTRGRSPKMLRQSATLTKAKPPAAPVYDRIRGVYNASQTQQNFLSYQPDDSETPVSQRDMSAEYGHGRTLGPDEPADLIPHILGTKRKGSLSASPSPKRVRFDSKSDETRQIQEGKVRSKPVSPAAPPSLWTEPYNVPEFELAGIRELPADPAQHLLGDLAVRPEPLGLRSAAELFRALQSEAETFSKSWFGFNKHIVKNLGGEHSRRNFPLYDLEHTYPALYMTTKNLLDIPNDNAKQAWLNYFTKPAQRQALVYGILGEWISQRVFNDSAFGLSDKIKQIMRHEIDIPYIHYDGFVRAKKRAELVRTAFEPSEERLTTEALTKASWALADELMTVLAPLMPTWKIKDPFLVNPSPTAALHKSNVAAELTEIIMKAAGLSLSLIRTGENNTIFRIASKLEKGREFNALAPMDCINLSEKMRVAHENPDIMKEKKLMVRMTCWARVEAFVGHGLDQEEMGNAQQELMAQKIEDVIANARRTSASSTMKHFEKSYKNFCWDCAAPGLLPELPSELWKPQAEHVDRIEMKSRAAKIGRKLDRQLVQQQRKVIDNDSNTDDDDATSDGSWSDNSDSSSSSESDVLHNTNDEGDEVPRGAYMTVIDKLVKHQVYCEWVSIADNHATYVAEHLDAPPNDVLRQLNSLPSIVRAARGSSSSSLVKMVDLKLRAWNLYASNNLWIEWASVLALTVYLSRGKLSGDATVLLDKLEDLFSARREDLHKVLHCLLPKLSLWQHSAKDFARKVLNSISEPNDLLEKVLEKLKEVMPMPPPIDFENGLLGSAHGPAAFGSAAAFKTAIFSAMAAVFPGLLPVTSAPLVQYEDITDYDSSTTGPAISLTWVENNDAEPTPSHRARAGWW